ncbi:MAG TPA: DUF308 domain-containing protein [Edaphocola sp.]|nr:DUF308 domain-containing protein [Edaphocola sp.]
MKTSFLKAIKHWYLPLLVGVFFLIVSVMVFVSPESSLLALSLLFAFSFIFGGVSEIIFSIANRNQLDNWAWSMVFGIITLIVGLLLMFNPRLSLTALAFYIGFLILFRSIATIGFALDIKSYGSKNWIGLLIWGIIGTIVSFILIWNPLVAGMSIVFFIGLGFLISGLFSIFLSFQLKKLHRTSKKISAKLIDRYDELMKEIREEWKGNRKREPE